MDAEPVSGGRAAEARLGALQVACGIAAITEQRHAAAAGLPARHARVNSPATIARFLFAGFCSDCECNSDELLSHQK